MEVPGDEDPSKATSRRVDFGPFAPRSGLRRSLRQTAVTAHRLLDDENVEIPEGERGVSLRNRGRCSGFVLRGAGGGGVLSRRGGGTEGASPSGGLGIL
ncbi:UNVERIFIED_CONTAM: hypothetical protein Sradi_2361200 [Sesamum radiatum]|uniref:Uncharacterized protein n=1 Tax=Sesamum radiatum TaxID=300843 RepID=A0AAW2T620_SESRA